jgi:hypothetical protein
MSGWTERLARALDVPPLSPGDEALLLDASRDVAHAVERKQTPLTAFLLGVAVGRDVGTGVARDDALDRALTVLAGVMPRDA